MVVPGIKKTARRKILLAEGVYATKTLRGDTFRTPTPRDREISLESQFLIQRRLRTRDPKHERSISRIFSPVQKLDPILAKRLRRIFSNKTSYDSLALSYRKEKGSLKQHHLDKLAAIRRLPRTRAP